MQQSQYNPTTWREKIVAMPLPVFFVYNAIVFGAITWVMANYVGQRRHESVADAIVQGAFFGLFMTLALHIRRKKLRKQFNGADPARLQIAAREAFKSGTLPQDKELLAVFPAYLDSIAVRNERTKKYGPFEFALFALLGLWLSYSDHTVVWLVFATGFLLLALYVRRSTDKVQVKIDELRQKLNHA